MITIEKVKECPPKNLSLPVKFITMGNIVEVQYMSRRNTKATIQMLPGGDTYLELSTGEVKDITHHETRADQKKSLYRTFRMVRGVINSNVTDVSRVRWITLTYAANMRDTKQLYKDFEKFHKRFCYKVEKMGYNKPEYIVMAEPQGRGAWHMHLLYIFDTVAPYLHNDDDFNPIWGHGITKIKKLKNVDNVGAYLTAYLGDMELDEVFKDGKVSDLIEWNNGSMVLGTLKEVEVEEAGKTVSKKFIKGARLPFYPANFNMFRCSRGILRPTEEMISQMEAEKKISAGTLTFEKTVILQDDETDFKSVINTRQYNMKKNKKC